MMSDDTERANSAPVATSQPTPAASAEFEIKFRADRPTLDAVLGARLLQGATVSPAREVISVYYDTPAFNVQRKGLSLRLRRKGRAVPVLGVKWMDPAAGELFARGEVETRASEGVPDIELLEPEVRDRLKDALNNEPLAPVFRTRVKRRIVLIRHGLSEIELALDDGIVTVNEQSRPLSEVELELKSGNAADLLNLARELTRDCGLSLQFEPKAGRGYRLAKGEAARPQKAKPLRLPSGSSFDDAIAAVIANCLSHFTANWACLRESDAPESVHQLRVALRRLRSALAMFRKRIAVPELEDIRARARHIASGLGPARECDAFRQNALAGPFRDQPRRLAAAAQLLAAVENRRKETYATARSIIEDPVISLFVLDVQSILTQRTWRAALGAQDLGLLTSPARDFASETLQRLRQRVLKRGKQLPNMPDEERHELRIALKNLRYAVEFFDGLFAEDKDLRNFLRLVADLQEDLGAHNDAATAEAFMTALNLAPDAQVHFAAGYLLGFYRHATIVADTHLTKKWKKFRHSRSFWA